MQVALEALGTSPATMVWALTDVEDAAIPPGAGCRGKDGWHVRDFPDTPFLVRYTNASDALPPTCTDGSARGLRRVQLRGRRDVIAFNLRATHDVFDALPPTGPLRATVVFGADAGAGAAGRCATFTWTPGQCTSEGRRFVCVGQ